MGETTLLLARSTVSIIYMHCWTGDFLCLLSQGKIAFTGWMNGLSVQLIFHFLMMLQRLNCMSPPTGTSDFMWLSVRICFDCRMSPHFLALLWWLISHHCAATCRGMWEISSLCYQREERFINLPGSLLASFMSSEISAPTTQLVSVGAW